MAKIQYQITFDLGAQIQIAGAVDKQVFPLLNQAVRAVAAKTAVDWKTNVQKAKLWSGEKDRYAESIKWEMTGDFSAVVESDYKWAAEIESGRPARDLKKMLDTSAKVRRTEDGRRFLIIPFRHGTPGAKSAMPGPVHMLASAMTPSKVVATGQRPSGQVTHLSPKSGMSVSAKQSAFLSNPSTKGASTVSSRSYQWGSSLTKGALKSAGMDAATAKRFAGMVKMDTSTPGGSRSSSYLTFRVMMEGSKGWIVPPKSGLYLAKKAADEMQPKANAAFAQAVKLQLSKA